MENLFYILVFSSSQLRRAFPIVECLYSDYRCVEDFQFIGRLLRVCVENFYKLIELRGSSPCVQPVRAVHMAFTLPFCLLSSNQRTVSVILYSSACFLVRIRCFLSQCEVKYGRLYSMAYGQTRFVVLHFEKIKPQLQVQLQCDHVYAKSSLTCSWHAFFKTILFQCLKAAQSLI